MSRETLTPEAIHNAVTNVYRALAKSPTQGSAGCCLPEVTSSNDYSAEELGSVPAGAYLGAGSGNPGRHAGLRRGEIVIDLGSGAGIDSFLAANLVGPSGRVHGFDLTPEMIERAQRNARQGDYGHVTFELSTIEHLPLVDSSADVAISNCVINLTPDKGAVFREIFRVLRPGGRLAISDIVMRGSAEAIAAVRQNPDLKKWCACVLGALEEREYLDAIRLAGFGDVRLVAERPAMSQPGGGVDAVAVTITAIKS